MTAPRPDSATLRAPVVLPTMPTEHEAATAYPPVELERARVAGERLVFDRPDGFDRALAQGFFLVAIPEELDTTAGDHFAAHFHEHRRGDGDPLDPFRGYRDTDVPGTYQGYFDREHDQWENFYIEQANWALLPDAVAQLGHQMTDLGVTVLHSVLAHLGLPERDWAEVTGGLTDYRGHHLLAFNHFRPEKAVRGSKFHRDSGWVTVLRSTDPGLLALIDGTLWAVNPEPGHFIVNFGSSLEVLTERLPRPVRANVHGVVSTERAPGQTHRTSYVTFLDSGLDSTVYRYEDGVPCPLQPHSEFAMQEVNRTYDDDAHL
ncbi:2OG-Fe(II) oxygenase family protein [Streptomyces sp. NPDC001739]